MRKIILATLLVLGLLATPFSVLAADSPTITTLPGDATVVIDEDYTVTISATDFGDAGITTAMTGLTLAEDCGAGAVLLTADTLDFADTTVPADGLADVAGAWTLNSNVVATCEYTITASDAGADADSTETFDIDWVYPVAITDIDFDDEVRPGETVTVTIEFENTASYDVEDVDVRVVLSGIERDGDDIWEDIPRFGLDSGTERTKAVTLTVPEDAREGFYAVEVLMLAEDESGAFLNDDPATPDPDPFIDASNELEVEKTKADIAISGDLALSSDAVEAGESAELAVTVYNRGTKDQAVALTLSSGGLGVSGALSFNLEQGERTTQYIPFTVPEDAEPGLYTLTLKTEYGSKTVTSTTTLTVEEAMVPASSLPGFAVADVQVAESEEGTSRPATITDEHIMLAGLVAGIVIVVIVIGALISHFMPSAGGAGAAGRGARRK